jgi:hypothetical protein
MPSRPFQLNGFEFSLGRNLGMIFRNSACIERSVPDNIARLVGIQPSRTGPSTLKEYQSRPITERASRSVT